MSVKAAADGGIGIASWTNTDGKAKQPAATAFKTIDTAAWSNQIGIDGATVKPTSGKEGAFYTGTAAESDEFTATGTFAALPAASADAANINAGYYNHTKWSIMSLNAKEDTTLKVASITVSADVNTEALNKSLRIAIKTTTNSTTTWNYFAPNADNGTTFTCVTGEALTATEAQTVKIGNAANGTVLGTLVKTPPAIVEVFIYYDGQDENCKTDNLAMNVDTLTVTIVYTNV
jgi:hypothetical protein